jgi:hypothetical protein
MKISEAKNDPGCVWHNIELGSKLNPALAMRLRKDYGLKCFVETGTNHGATAELAALMFEEVLTCELFPERFQEIATRLAAYPHVTRHEGDSVLWLKSLDFAALPPTLIWLDAHWTGEGERPAQLTPVIEELRAIGNAWQKHCVLVDDMRFCCHYRNPGWPTEQEIGDACRQLGLHTKIIGDVLVGTPKELTW